MSNSRGPQPFAAAASDIAREAGELLLSYLGKVAIEFKGEADLVTAADRASEALIVERLRAQFPDHAFVAEEGSHAESPSGYCWFVDPLDGTTNFAHRLPAFAVSLGLEHHGRRIAGAVFNPVLDEMFTASAGAGSHLNGRPIAVSAASNLADALVATGFPSRKRHKNPNIHLYQYFSLRSQGVRRFGSAALDLCYTACGRFDAFWEFNLKPWDTCAASLVLTEAGGQLTDLLGAPYHGDSPEVVASNGPLHPALLAAFAALAAGDKPPLAALVDYLAERP